MKFNILILFLLLFGIRIDVFSQSIDNYNADYILDDRIIGIIKDFYKEKGYSKVISISYRVENYHRFGNYNKTQITDTSEVHFFIYPIRDLSDIFLNPPIMFTKFDSSIVLINTGFEEYFSRNSGMFRNLIDIVKPYIYNNINIISYNPLRIKFKATDEILIDDNPYGMEYIFKSNNEKYFEKHEDNSTDFFIFNYSELKKIIIRE